MVNNRTYDNVLVTEVGLNMIVTRPLREVCEDASAICIRRLLLKSDVKKVSRSVRLSVHEHKAYTAQANAAEKIRKDMWAKYMTFKVAVMRKPYTDPLIANNPLCRSLSLLVPCSVVTPGRIACKIHARHRHASSHSTVVFVS